MPDPSPVMLPAMLLAFMIDGDLRLTELVIRLSGVGFELAVIAVELPAGVVLVDFKVPTLE